MIDSTLKNRYTNESFSEGLILKDAEGLVIDLATLSKIQVDFDFKDDRTIIKWEYPTIATRKPIELTDSALGLMTVFVDASDTENFKRQETVYVSVKYWLTDADYESGFQKVESDKVAIFNLLTTRL